MQWVLMRRSIDRHNGVGGNFVGLAVVAGMTIFLFSLALAWFACECIVADLRRVYILLLKMTSRLPNINVRSQCMSYILFVHGDSLTISKVQS